MTDTFRVYCVYNPKPNVKQGKKMIEFLSASEMPNWITLILGANLIGLLTWLWRKRKVSHITGLEVSLNESTMQINSEESHAVVFEFANRTDKRVIVLHPIVKNRTELFPISKRTSEDIAQRTSELKFLDQCGGYSQHVVTIDTGQNAHTALPLKEIPPELISRISKRPSILFSRKYFTLEYEVLYGKRWYKVSTNY